LSRQDCKIGKRKDIRVEKQIEDITFDNCKVGAKVLSSINDADFKINPFVKNIIFV